MEAIRYWTQLFTVSRTDGPRALTFMKPAAVIVRVIRVGEAQELEPPVADGEAVIAGTPHLTSAVLVYERQEVACRASTALGLAAHPSSGSAPAPS